MKKEKNEMTLVINLLVFCIFKIIIAAALLLGFFCSIGCIVELFSSIMTMSVGMLIILTLAGLIFYVDFIPEEHRQKQSRSLAVRGTSAAPRRQTCR